MGTAVGSAGIEFQAADAHGVGETATKYTGVRRNKGGRFSARIKISGNNKYVNKQKQTPLLWSCTLLVYYCVLHRRST
jgi:hypothetical protein